MRTKRDKLERRTIDCKFNFEVKAAGGDTFIQGWANKHVVDRGKDIINMDAWNLDNYKKVPTILFNHDKDKPIGKAVDVRPTDQGLWIKAKISNSKDPEISKIRDLINEGMLNAFSVGFDAQDEQKNADGINEIKNAELYEVSVVTLPMNQDSVFDVTTKSLQGLSKDKAVSKILRAKGAWVAETVHGKIYDMEKSGVNRDDLLSKISDDAGIDKDMLAQVLSGNITPVPEKVLGAFAQVLGLDIEKLQKLDEGDMKVQKTTSEGGDGMGITKPEFEDQNGEEEPDANTTETIIPPASRPKKDASEQGSEETGIDVDVIGITIPKDQADTSETAMQMVSDAGYDPQNVVETDQGWYVLLADPADFETPTGTLDLGEGAMATVGIRKGPDADADDQPSDTPSAEGPLNPEGKAPPAPPEDPKKKPKKPFYAPAANTQPPAPITDAPADPGSQGVQTPPPPAAGSDEAEEDMPAGSVETDSGPNPTAASPKPPTAPATQPPPAGKPIAKPPQAVGDNGVDPAQAKQDYEAFKQDETNVMEGKPGAMPSWVADEALWAKATGASQAAIGKIDYAFVVSWYLQNGGGKKSEGVGRQKKNKDAPISGGGDATIPIDDNPYLAQARQTNILLGVLIEEFRGMCAAMQGNAVQPNNEQSVKTEVMPDEENYAEIQKQVEVNLKKYLVMLDSKLKKIGA